MTEAIGLTGRLIAAARALVGVSQKDFAAASGLSDATFARLEAAGSAWVRSEREVSAIEAALKHYGVLIIEESGGMGAGVRLKFTRTDVRQIVRLEGEGGIIASDDAP